MRTKESWAALLFLALTAAVTVFYLMGVLAPVEAPAPLRGAAARWAAAERRRPMTEKLDRLTARAEAGVNSQLDRDRLFIQLYGGVQRMAGRRIIEDTEAGRDVIKLSDGSLTFVTSDSGEPEAQRGALTQLKEELSQREVPLLYVQAPNKLSPGDTRLPDGVADSSNDYSDGVLSLLEQLDIPSLDLRRTLQDSGRPWGSFFFRTDHHWTPETALLAARTISGVLEEDYGLKLDSRALEEANYDKRVYADWFLGSLGKRVGSLYGGVDDLTAYTPRFYTLLNHEVYSQGIDRTGSFSNTVMFYQRVARRDWFSGNPYTLYAGGDYPSARITNYQNPDGPRVFLLRDSYGCAMTPFLSLACGELITFDLRYFGEKDRLMNYVDWLKPDIVIMMYTSGRLSLDTLLQF